MQSKHRRTPSAIASIGYNLNEDEPAVSFLSNASFEPPQIPGFKTKDKDISKIIQKNTTNFDHINNRKFSHNYSISSNNEYCSFLSSSAENLVKEMNQLNELNEEDENSYDEYDDNPCNELIQVVKEIMKNSEAKGLRLKSIRKGIKSKLHTIFCQNENSDIDTERRIDNVRCSGDTIEGPGSTYHYEDISLVKFDASVENYEKKKKSFMFKGF